MADKIDQLTIGSTSYDIDLPPDAEPSIKSLTTSGDVTIGGKISHGNYNYTLPSISGTIALVGSDTDTWRPVLVNGSSVLDNTAPSGKNLNLEAGSNITLTAEEGVGDIPTGKIIIAANNTATAANDILQGANSGTQITYSPYTTRQSGLTFDTTSTAPTGTSRLNLNGKFYATEVYAGSTKLTGNTGTVTGSSLTANYIIVGNGSSAIKKSTYLAGPSSVTWSETSDVYLPTMKAISNWASPKAGSSSITTLGTITTGTWNGTAIVDSYISSASTWNSKYDKPSTGIPSTDLAESYYLASNPNGYTSNTGTVIGSSLTADYFALGNGTVNIKASSMKPTTSSTTWSTTSDVNVPTMKAISNWASPKAGSSSITTLGTITTGTWHGTAISPTYISSSGITSTKFALFADGSGKASFSQINISDIFTSDLDAGLVLMSNGSGDAATGAITNIVAGTTTAAINASKGKYLHSNSSTGALEWSTVSAGSSVYKHLVRVNITKCRITDEGDNNTVELFFSVINNSSTALTTSDLPDYHIDEDDLTGRSKAWVFTSGDAGAGCFIFTGAQISKYNFHAIGVNDSGTGIIIVKKMPSGVITVLSDTVTAL